MDVGGNILATGIVSGSNIGSFSRGGTIVNTVDYLPATAIYIPVWYASVPCRVTNVRAKRVDGTLALVNARKNTSLHLASSLALSVTGAWYDGGTVQNTDYAVGDTLEIGSIATTGSVSQLAIQVDFVRLSS